MIVTNALLGATLGVLLGAGPPATAPVDLPAESLYQLEGRFEDQTGTARALADFAGAPTLFAMFYATCPRACPMLISDVKNVLGKLTAEERTRVRVVLVSLDPARDTPAVLAKTMEARGLDASRWTLMRTSPENTRALAAALGVRYRAQGDGSVDHTSRIVLLDAGGVMVGRKDGLGGTAEDLIAAVRSLVLSPRSPG